MTMMKLKKKKKENYDEIVRNQCVIKLILM